MRDVSSRPLPPGERAPRPYPSLHAVSPGFVQALGLRIVEGRTFSVGELARREALVSRAFANSGFFDGPALGRQVYGGKISWKSLASSRMSGSSSWTSRLAPRCSSSTSFPRRLVSAGPISRSGPRRRRWRSAAEVRSIVRQIDPAATVDNVATMEQILSNAVSGPRLYAVLLGSFAAVAVALAAIGIYGVLAFIVTHRAREIGIRMALGARPAAVVSLVVRQSAVQIVIGVAAGIGGAALLSRYLEGLLLV